MRTIDFYSKYAKMRVSKIDPMGSDIKINDTLQISKEQGFPSELNYEAHCHKPLRAEDLNGKEFEFHGKPGIRMYQVPPVRNFLVENRGGKWIYWGLIHITKIVHDYANKTTSGKFHIVYMYTPEEMQHAHAIIDRNKDTDFFRPETEGTL